MSQHTSPNIDWTPGDSDHFYKVEALMLQLLAANRRLFICDCADRVIHLYEAEFTGDQSLRHVIQVVRRYVIGNATVEELAAAYNDAENASYRSEEEGLAIFKQWPPYYVSEAIRIAASVDDLLVNPVYGSRLVIETIEASGGSRTEEQTWQYQQVRRYLQNNHE